MDFSLAYAPLRCADCADSATATSDCRGKLFAHEVRAEVLRNGRLVGRPLVEHELNVLSDILLV